MSRMAAMIEENLADEVWRDEIAPRLPQFPRCPDGMCGADDCARCHPETCRPYPCACCQKPCHYTEIRGKHDVCADCEDKEPCGECGQWFDFRDVTNGLCKGCTDCKIKGA